MLWEMETNGFLQGPTSISLEKTNFKAIHLKTYLLEPKILYAPLYIGELVVLSDNSGSTWDSVLL